MKSFFLMTLFLVITQLRLFACPVEIARAPQKYRASLYEIRLLNAIYRHENSQHKGYCMAVLSPKFRGCRAQVRQALRIIRMEWRKWDRQGRKGGFIKTLGLRYCPPQYDKIGHFNW